MICGPLGLSLIQAGLHFYPTGGGDELISVLYEITPSVFALRRPKWLRSSPFIGSTYKSVLHRGPVT